jgi:hypothetical protein
MLPPLLQNQLRYQIPIYLALLPLLAPLIKCLTAELYPRTERFDMDSPSLFSTLYGMVDC